MLYLITYDIPNDKRRKTISILLDEYGIRVNYSVYECKLNVTKRNKLKKEIEKIINKKEDNIRFYSLCKNCLTKSFVLGTNPPIFQEEDLFFL